MDGTKCFRIAVRGLIYNQNDEVLLLRRSRATRGEDGYWELPGGGLEHGESPQKALEREVAEETHLTVGIGIPVLVWDYLRSDHMQIIGMTFSCHWTSGSVELSHEHDDYSWVKLHDIKNYKIFPELKDEIESLLTRS